MCVPKRLESIVFTAVLLALLRCKLRNVTVVYTSITLTEIFRSGKLNSLKRSFTQTPVFGLSASKNNWILFVRAGTSTNISPFRTAVS